MKKTRKLVLSRETLHSLELRDVTGAGTSLGLCGETTGGSTTTNTSNSNFTCNTGGVCSGGCTSGGACTVDTACHC